MKNIAIAFSIIIRLFDDLCIRILYNSNRKRQKLSHDQPVLSPHWKVLPEDITESEFFEQMGIGMLDSEESLSNGEGQLSKQSLEVNPPSITKDLLHEDEKNQNFEGFSSKDAQNDTSCSRVNLSSYDVYTDPVSTTSECSGRAIRSQAISKIVANTNTKKRSPLATVANNNNIMRSENSLVSKKYAELMADEKYFAFKIEQAELLNQPSKYS